MRKTARNCSRCPGTSGRSTAWRGARTVGSLQLRIFSRSESGTPPPVTPPTPCNRRRHPRRQRHDREIELTLPENGESVARFVRSRRTVERGRWKTMNTYLLVSNIVLLIAVLLLAFLVLGVLRALGLMSWRLEQIEVTSPRRIGRDGLLPGKTAPDFTLPSDADGDVSLRDF